MQIVWSRDKNRPESAPETSVVDTRSGIQNNFLLTSSKERAQDLSLEGFQLRLVLTSHSSPVLPRNGKSANFLLGWEIVFLVRVPGRGRSTRFAACGISST